jgi:predicted lipoprotein with Yx(FWY)xxD motif
VQVEHMPGRLASGQRQRQGAHGGWALREARDVKRKRFTQATLNGHPLYTFSEDAGMKGSASGEGLHSFGGTWHVSKER